MIKSIISFVRRLYGDKEIDPCEHPYATATTPDQIIAEAMKASMAKDIKGWRRGRPPVSDSERRIGRLPSDYYHYEITNKDRSLVLSWEDRSYNLDNPTKFKVNGIEFDKPAALDIIDAYDRLRAAVDRAEAAARKAKLAMEANENKWNLAESLLGLKRNEFGALVPVVKVEG